MIDHTDNQMALPQVIQFWDLPDTPHRQVVSFDLSPSQESELVTWRMDLPGSLASAGKMLEQSEQQILVSERAIENIPIQIDALANQLINQNLGDLSFQFADVSSAEGELIDLLNLASPDIARVNFDVASRSSSNWQEANKLFESSLDRLNRLFTQFAAVETSMQGRLIGHTVVSWSGKYLTSWQIDVDTNSMSLHQRSLRVAMASRRLFLNMFSASAVSAAKLSALLAIPGGALLTIPAIWKFVTRIISEIEKYQNLTQ
jgi:hypothetical protein